MKKLVTPYDGVEMVEIPIKNTSETKYYLPDIPSLKGKIIKRIEIPHDVTTTPRNRTILSSTNLRASYITIISHKVTFVNRLPLFALIKFGTNNPSPMDLFDIDLEDTEQSYIEFSKGASLTTAESIFMNFYYINPSKKKLIQRIPFIQQLKPYIFEKREIEKVYPVQIEIINTSETVFYLPNDEFLKNKCVTNIRLFAYTSPLTTAVTLKTPDNKTMISDTIYKKSYLVLQLVNGQKINNLPCTLLLNEYFSQRRIFFNDVSIDWPKSYIKVANTTGLTANTCFYLVIYYKDKRNVNKYRTLRRNRKR